MLRCEEAFSHQSTHVTMRAQHMTRHALFVLQAQTHEQNTMMSNRHARRAHTKDHDKHAAANSTQTHTHGTVGANTVFGSQRNNTHPYRQRHGDMRVDRCNRIAVVEQQAYNHRAHTAHSTTAKSSNNACWHGMGGWMPHGVCASVQRGLVHKNAGKP